MIISAPTQVKGLDIKWLYIQQHVHLLYGRVELIDLDITACTEQVTVFNDFVNYFIFLVELVVKAFNAEHFNCLLEVSESVKVVASVIVIQGEFPIPLCLLYLLLLVQGNL
jgi:hypothetical protein